MLDENSSGHDTGIFTILQPLQKSIGNFPAGITYYVS